MRPAPRAGVPTNIGHRLNSACGEKPEKLLEGSCRMPDGPYSPTGIPRHPLPQSATNCFGRGASNSRFDGGDVDLLHRHHRLERTFRRVSALRECIGQYPRDDLPANAPFVLAPAALALLPPVADDRVPVAVGLCLILRRDLEGKGLTVLVVRPAIESDTGYARDGEFDNQGIACFAVGIVARRTVDCADTALGKCFRVEARGLFGIVVVPEADRVLGHLINSFLPISEEVAVGPPRRDAHASGCMGWL